jgi:hypothetical protein
MNETYRPLIYAADVDFLGKYLHTVKKNTNTLLVASKKAGLEVNTEKTGQNQHN